MTQRREAEGINWGAVWGHTESVRVSVWMATSSRDMGKNCRWDAWLFAELKMTSYSILEFEC